MIPPKTSVGDLVRRIRDAAARRGPMRLMEVCGTHTVSLFRSGVRSILPAAVELVSGPGCPVCVTAQGYLDAAVALAGRRNMTVCTYGDMLRVPGHGGSLELSRARGARVEVCYSVRDALQTARRHPDRECVFLAVGFETTAPATALALKTARDHGLKNFSILGGHKRVMPALHALLSTGDAPLDGLMLPGHVSAVIGADVYRPLVDAYGIACVIMGFEAEQLLTGIAALTDMLDRGEARLENVYPQVVKPEGNPAALAVLDEVFQPGNADWRAMGVIPDSGLDLRPGFAQFDARDRFDIEIGPDRETPGCLCGQVIQGRTTPDRCALFGTTCTPESPIGPCMVSSEGTCAAWHRYTNLGATA